MEVMDLSHCLCYNFIHLYTRFNQWEMNNSFSSDATKNIGSLFLHILIPILHQF